MRVAFAGTPEFARVALQAIDEAGFTAALVLTQPDRPAGRGMKLQASAVKQYAQQQGWPLAQPRSLRLDGRYAADAAAARLALTDAAPDVLVVAAYGLILPAWTLALPRLGCLNIHGSLLPRWRGAAPIHRAIEAGDAQTGITIMQMDAGLDTGAMLLRQAMPILATDSTASLHDRLAAAGGRLIVQALQDADAGRLQPVAQPLEGVNYAHKVDKAEAAIDWALPAATLERRVRAFDPFPGMLFSHGGEPVKLWRAALVPGAAPDGAAPGQVLAAGTGRLLVVCGDGVLELLELQR
ncbi:MAG: methionyl-tRNA formyltransferase, partial [Rubrivivax sp.]|nr:methionyl-tRNA formyltransferase [Rubrivivax sp.]